MSDVLKYGPVGREEHYEFTKFPTPKYLRGYANKIIKDLNKVARMYNGKEIVVFRQTGTERCTACTNSITGEILHSHCRQCNGTGKVDSWSREGSYWAYVDFGPGYDITQMTGNTKNPGNAKETFIIIGAPLLTDQDFFVVKETKEIHKIFNVEPRIIAMGGTVVAQAAMASSIENGSPMHRVIDW